MQTQIVRAIPRDMRVGRRETIPRWSMSSRLMVGAIPFSMPVIALAFAVTQLRTTGPVEPATLAAAYGFLVAHCLITFLYDAFAAQNPRLGRARTPWLISLVLAGPITILVYWVMHVWGAPMIGRRGVDENMPGEGEAVGAYGTT